jgi:putative ABC transport system substrate-binding protein
MNAPWYFFSSLLGEGNMKRRAFITLFSSAAVWPLAGGAQTPPKIPRVGFLGIATPTTVLGIATPTTGGLEALRHGLRDLGYVEGQTIALEVRWAEGRSERLPELAAELLRLKVDVLFVGSGTAALAAKKATGTIPIVMVAGDPVGLGLVASLARPGGNVTGLSYFTEGVTARRLQLLKELVPGLTRVAVLRIPGIALHAIFWREIEVAAQKLGVALQPLEVRLPEDFEAAFASATRGKAQALIVFDEGLTVVHGPRIVALAANSRLPAMYGFREFPDDGGLMSYGPNTVVLFRRAATFVDKILKGAKPADLPVEQPTKFELIINRKTANALGLTLPPTLLTQADEVIE